MRWTTVTSFALLTTALVTATTALAGTPEDPEITDPTGDVGPAPVGLGPIGEDVDLRRAWFVAGSPGSPTQRADGLSAASCLHPYSAEDTAGVWAAMELASFDTPPAHVVYEIAFTVGNASAWVGHGEILDPETGELQEGYYGCRSTHPDGQAQPGHGGRQARHGNCEWLDGAVFDDDTGFRVRIPSLWVPPGAVIEEPTARTYLLLELPGDDPAGWDEIEALGVFDEAGPGGAFHVPGASSDEQVNATRATPETEPGSVNEAPGLGWALALASIAFGATASARRIAR